MGKVKYGKGGTIESGTSVTRCTPPAKRYAKNLDAIVKASVDSVGNLPTGQIELGLKQTVTRLSDYTSEGLDIDLLLFRLCEMANNRGLSAEQVERLNSQTIEAWKTKSASKIDVINNGVVNGIMAGVVVIPEDTQVPLLYNFVVNFTYDNTNERLRWEIMPKQGTWSSPYIGYLIEDSLINASICWPEGVLMGIDGENVVNIDGKLKPTRTVMSSTPASINKGLILTSDTKPSIIFFGDIEDSQKQYYIRL